MALPRFVVLKSEYNNKYLSYIDEDVQMHGFLRFFGEEAVSPYTKCEVEMSKSGKGLVHIRSCYNNKYWVRQSQNHWWIVAGAEEPEEDQSKWSCTLFEPVSVDGDATTFRFRHVQLGHYACLWRAAPPFESCLFAGSADVDRDRCDVCTIIDWESLLIPPKHIAFKGDNGNYLSSRLIHRERRETKMANKCGCWAALKRGVKRACNSSSSTDSPNTIPPKDVVSRGERREKMALPRFVVLKSEYNDKYLSYIDEDVQVHGFLRFFGEEVVSPYTKCEVEMSKSDKGLVHIRSCYNNKYWVRWSQHHWWIVAGAEEPEEDQSKWSCTLFEPVSVDGDATTVRFRHVQLGHYACLWRAAPPFESCLFAGSADVDRDRCDVCTIIDWESLLILPKHIAFKGDNGNYLSSRVIEKYPYHQFASRDIGDPTVGFEVFTTRNGSIRIKSHYFGKFWRRSPNWIWADSDDPTSNNSDTLFWPIKVGNNVVALRNLGNNNFCKRLTTEGKTNCLNAGVSTISNEARLEVEELVISRNIYNVNFRLMDARIYSQQPLMMANGDAVNRTNEPNTIDVKLSYTETKSRTWNGSVSLKLGVTTSIVTGVPLIAEGKIAISAEFSVAYQWGETVTTTTGVETVYKVTVPPMTRVKVSLLATQGSCDVPFSYYQRDTLFDGQQSTVQMDDGVFTGINCFNFKYETKQEPL